MGNTFNTYGKICNHYFGSQLLNNFQLYGRLKEIVVYAATKFVRTFGTQLLTKLEYCDSGPSGMN